MSRDGSLVFVGGGFGYLYAINAADGIQRWRFKADGTSFADAPTGAWSKIKLEERRSRVVESSPSQSADGTTVFFSSLYGHIYAIEAATGKRKWKFVLLPENDEVAVYSTPTAAGDTVFVGSRDHRLSTWTKKGSTRFQMNALTTDMSAVVAKKWDYKTRELDGVSGRSDFRYNPSSQTISANGDTVFFGSNDHRLYVVDATTGKLNWEFKTGGRVESTPAVSGGTVFVGSHDGNLYAFDAESGKKKWTLETDGMVRSSPVVSSFVLK